ncbi:TIGR02266 family protein [Myxococcus sp. RHSTA-1-4]|uniref:TIGR02266 family protein n=1 Tax=Myxococcus sp. RHSTA-1-4 TaxID=2874601 RepID=UPI0021053036|nr:TIGR02266 family protein [Myxococcus sp. RHSTA-1-4]MBZ4421834.1 TIGR02266 family protein [Myxococcus sp. RHSTA-1-4]
MSGLASKLLPLRIRLPYTTEDEFIDKYGSNVARGGVFVATRALKPEGTGLAFEFVLADGARLLRGEGVVVKAQADAGGGRTGMTVRFVKLDAASKALIDRVVARRGGIVEPPPPAAPPAPPPGLTRRVTARGAMGAARVTPPPVGAGPAATAEAPANEPMSTEAATSAPSAARPEPDDDSLGFDITASLSEPEPEDAPAPRESSQPFAGSTSIEQSRTEAPALVSPEAVQGARVKPPPAHEDSTPGTSATRQEERTPLEAGPSAPLSATAPTGSIHAAPPVTPAEREKPEGPSSGDSTAEASTNPTALEATLLGITGTHTDHTEPEAHAPANHAGAESVPAAVAPTDRAEPVSPPTTATSADRAGSENAPATPAPTDRAEPESTATTATRPAPEPPPATATPTDRAAPESTATTATRPEPEPPPATATPTGHAAPESTATTATRTAPTDRAEPETPPSAAQDAEAVRNRRRALLDVPVTAAAPAPAIPEVVLGIDLGTTHARVAVFHEGTAKLVPIPGTDGTELPALVAVDGSDELLIGAGAQVEASRAPRRATSGLKRLLGLRAHSPRVRDLSTQLPFPVSVDPRGDAAVELGGRLIAPTLFTAMLLRELKHAAATFIGRKATRAVISAPTHFTDRQRAALREAATLAGLDAQRILTAPAAAALAYGHGRGLARKRVLVVDLGGGGLEVCVVQVTGDDLEVITTGGDATVGGMDFDARIAEALASDLDAQGVPRPQHLLDWAPLRNAAESTKVALSEREQVDVPLSTGTVPPFTRERVEALTADLAQRVTTVVREVLESNALSPQGLDAVLLVGGQSRAPLVRRRLEESLGVPVRDDVDPRGAVALGAALLGQALLLAEAGKPAASVSEVLSAPIGVAERGGTLRRVLERNTRLPTSKTLVLPVTTPGPLELALFQGPSPLAAENEYLGRLQFSVERPGEVELHFALSADGALSLEATLPGAKRKPVSLSAEDLDDAARDALIARSPLEGEPEARPGGLLSGLKKLFGRR